MCTEVFCNSLTIQLEQARLALYFRYIENTSNKVGTCKRLERIQVLVCEI